MAIEGTVTASSSRKFSRTVTRVPGQRISSVLGMVARTGTVPVVGSTVFSIMVTCPAALRGSPGTSTSMFADSLASEARNSGRLRCGSENVT